MVSLSLSLSLSLTHTHTHTQTSNRPDIAGAGKVGMTFEVTGTPGWQHRMERVERIHERHNTHIRTQCHVRPQGFLQSITSRMNLLLLSKCVVSGGPYSICAPLLPLIACCVSQHRTMRGLETRSSRPDDVARLLAQLRVAETRATIIGEMEQGTPQRRASAPPC